MDSVDHHLKLDFLTRLGKDDRTDVSAGGTSGSVFCSKQGWCCSYTKYSGLCPAGAWSSLTQRCQKPSWETWSLPGYPPEKKGQVSSMNSPVLADVMCLQGDKDFCDNTVMWRLLPSSSSGLCHHGQMDWELLSLTAYIWSWQRLGQSGSSLNSIQAALWRLQDQAKLL